MRSLFAVYALLALCLLPACAQLAPVRANIVRGVESYCSTFSADERRILRAQVAEGLAKVCVMPAGAAEVSCGASIQVHCPGDAPASSGDAGANAGR